MTATDAPSLPLVIGIPFLCMLVTAVGVAVVWVVLGRLVSR